MKGAAEEHSFETAYRATIALSVGHRGALKDQIRPPGVEIGPEPSRQAARTRHHDGLLTSGLPRISRSPRLRSRAV
jgi:hypothetical protein